MSNIPKFYLLPLLAGFILHLATSALNQIVFFQVSSHSVENADNLQLLYYLADWFNLLHAVLPGLVVGYLAKKRPALLGFCSILIAQIFSVFFLQSSFSELPFLLQVIQFSTNVLPPAFYGLVSSLAGFTMSSRVLTTQSRGTSV